MRVLGIDTSSFALGISLIEDERIIFDLLINSGIPRSEDIIEIMSQWINNPAEIDGFGIALGPGSFTGLRVGIATVKGFALGFKKPVAGIPTLDAFVQGIISQGVPYAKYRITPIMDAKMDEVYTASYENDGRRLTSYLSIKPAELLDKLGDHIFVGNGVKIYSNLIKEKLGNRAHFISPNPDSPRGSWVAALALKRLKEGDSDNIDSLEPIYLHPPRIKHKT